ncbi:J domain-containing protein [Sandarakinorhabdus sp.]|uniref:J domain-containing protein n=1 Tax=Sandarakinorhabdus sp. TaxID=1916663 RepID=UPI00286E7948|nr:J domain-containing protein [Sandarakinorhabdus sp.]
MAIALILAAALAWWLHKRGELLPNLVRLFGTGAAALIALRMLETGKPIVALVAGGIGYVWWRTQAPPSPQARATTMALKTLGLPPGADTVQIHAAWRARMAQVHPDAGGSAAAVQAVTAARDHLLNQRETIAGAGRN